ncbi:MAG: acyl carrier protein [Polyangiaceae bacterium]|jgi:acyl carrier protein
MVLQGTLNTLLERCIEEGLFVPGVLIDPSADLVEAGLIDSMGLVQSQSLIEEGFGVLIAVPTFVAELRTLAKVAGYVEAGIRDGGPPAAVSPAGD